MEDLIPVYRLPPRAVYDAVDALGIISLKYLRDGGDKAQQSYLLQQYVGFRATCEQRRLSQQPTPSAAEASTEPAL